MPITLHIDAGTGFRTHTVDGPLTLDELRESITEAYGHPDYDSAAAALWDLRKVVGDFASEDVRHLADFVAKSAGEGATGKVAVVVTSDFEFGMARMYETILNSLSQKPIRAFRDMEKAKHWLAVEE